MPADPSVAPSVGVVGSLGLSETPVAAPTNVQQPDSATPMIDPPTTETTFIPSQIILSSVPELPDPPTLSTSVATPIDMIPSASMPIEALSDSPPEMKTMAQFMMEMSTAMGSMRTEIGGLQTRIIALETENKGLKVTIEG
jgi:hypothetical protein